MLFLYIYIWLTVAPSKATLQDHTGEAGFIAETGTLFQPPQISSRTLPLSQIHWSPPRYQGLQSFPTTRQGRDPLQSGHISKPNHHRLSLSAPRVYGSNYSRPHFCQNMNETPANLIHWSFQTTQTVSGDLFPIRLSLLWWTNMSHLLEAVPFSYPILQLVITMDVLWIGGGVHSYKITRLERAGSSRSRKSISASWNF